MPPCRSKLRQGSHSGAAVNFGYDEGQKGIRSHGSVVLICVLDRTASIRLSRFPEITVEVQT